MPNYGQSYEAGDVGNYGDYYEGDYYQAGGLFSFLGNIGKKLLGATPVGMAVRTASSLLPTFSGSHPLAPSMDQGPLYPTPRGYRRKEPGIRGGLHRLFPGGYSGYLPRRRRMNPLNIKALRRSGRRVKGFLRIAHRLGALPVTRGKGKKLFRSKKRG